MSSPTAHHLIPAETWRAADPAAPLGVASLEDEGFIHLTHRLTDLIEVANTFYRDDPRPQLVLTIRLESVTSPVRYDGDERFPHVYGPIDRAAITEVRPIERRADGTYLPLDGEEGPDSVFDAAIDAAIERLPPEFAAQLESVAVVVEDEATPEQLAAVRAHGLFGLYQGVPRTRWGVDNVPLANKITLFRGPLTRAHPGRGELVAAITETLYHEIAHHLGIDDDRLRELRLEGRRNA